MRRGTCCTQKAVLVTVYVERPLRRRIPGNQSHKHHHTPLLHHPITGTTLTPTPRRIRGGDRKAELLHYSHGLRQSARSAPPARTHPPPAYHHQPAAKIVAVEVKRRPSRGPSCIGSLIPSFMRSVNGKKGRQKSQTKRNGSTTSMMTGMVKSFQPQKKYDFFSKFISTLRKRK